MPISDLAELLAEMRPELNPGRYAFVWVPADAALDSRQVIASVREAEGLSVVVPEQLALDARLPIAFTAAWITLTVHSDLEAVGLTAAFSRALGEAGIPCNVVAGVHHDHLFVPVPLAQAALEALRSLSRGGARRSASGGAA